MYRHFTNRNPRRGARQLTALLIVGALLSPWLTGCGDGRRSVNSPGGPGSGEGPTADELTDLGWLAFERGDFAEAEANFQSALGTDSSFTEALNGAGWSLMNLGRLSAADSAFSDALAGGLETADPHAGAAVIRRDLEPADFSGAIFSARDALAIEPRYVFDHDQSFDWNDLRLIIGQAAWELGSYDTVNDQIDSLGGNVQDNTSPTFPAELLQELERLGAESGGE